MSKVYDGQCQRNTMRMLEGYNGEYWSVLECQTNIVGVTDGYVGEY